MWIDHNTFSADRDHDKDYYAGLLDINHGSDSVTVSWNNFADHFKGSLVGHGYAVLRGNDLGGAGTGKL